MMIQEMTSKEVEITSSLSDMLVSSGVVETRICEPERNFLGKQIKTHFLFTHPIMEMMQTENVSSRYQPPKFETETVLIDEFSKKSEQKQLLLELSEIIDKFTGHLKLL